MLTPQQFVEKLTPEEIIGLIEQLGTKEFDCISIERDENLDAEVRVWLRLSQTVKTLKVSPVWPISA